MGEQEGLGIRSGAGAAGHGEVCHQRHPPVLVRRQTIQQAVQGWPIRRKVQTLQ